MYRQDLEYYIKKFRMDLQEAVFDKEVFREELRTQKLKVAKLGKQNLKITETRQELKDSRIMVHVKDVETQKLERNSRNIKGRHERLRVNRDDLAKELEKDKHDRKKPSETWTRIEEFDDFEDLLTIRSPNPYYIPELKHLTGNDKEVYNYVMTSGQAMIFLNQLYDMIKFLIPNYILEGKNQIVISIGCTGGKHRSVTIANALAGKMQELPYGLKAEHRDIGKWKYKRGNYVIFEQGKRRAGAAGE